MTATFFQVVASVLITMEFSKEIYSATKILTYLKRTRSHRSKIINVLLASMQLLVPIVTMISYMINVIQQENVSQITKSFVALSIVVKIDDMFSASLPKEILDNAIKLNEE